MIKKIVLFSLTCVLFSLILQACGSSKGSCDAYGQNKVELNSDLAKK